MDNRKQSICHKGLLSKKGEITIKTRYEEITVDMIKNSIAEELAEDHYLLKHEFSNLDDAIPLTGGRISRVYKINDDGIDKVLKISVGHYRMTELLREEKAMKHIIIHGGESLIPQIYKSKTMKNCGYLLEEYIEGESVREKLSKCKLQQERLHIWKRLGQTLSEIHKLNNREDLECRWLEEQLEKAKINMANKLIDIEEFKEEAPEVMLEWLISHKPKGGKISLIHGDFRTKNILIDKHMNYKVIDWGFVDIGDPYYDLAIIDYYFNNSDDRDCFYEGYRLNSYDKALINYYDKLSKFINI